MKWIASALFFPILFILTTAAAAAGGDRLDELLSEHMAQWMQEYQVPGVLVTFVDQEGGAWTRPFGYADHSRRLLVTPATEVPLGRITEVFSAAAIQSRLGALEEDIAPLLPNRYHPGSGQELTLRQLMDHTSGINSSAYLLSSFAQDAHPLSSALDAHWAGYSADPGADTRLSSLNYSLAALAVENIEEEPFHRLFENEIIQRAGLEHTTLGLLPSAAPDDRMRSHRRTNLGYTHYPAHETALYPSLGLYTTGDDLQSLLHFLLDHTSSGGGTDEIEPASMGLFPVGLPEENVYARFSQLPGMAGVMLFLPDEGRMVFAAANSDEGTMLLRSLQGAFLAANRSDSENEELSRAEQRNLGGSYQRNTISRQGLDRFTALLGQYPSIEIRRGSGDDLIYQEGDYQEPLINLGNRTFQGAESGSIVRFYPAQGEGVQFLETDHAPGEAWNRQGLLQTISAGRVIWSVLILILAMDVFSPWLFPSKRRKHRPDPPSFLWTRRVTVWLFGAAVLLVITSLLNHPVYLLPLQVPSGLIWAQRLLLAAGAACVALLAVTVYTWLQTPLPVGRKIGYTVITVFYLSVFAYASYWNLPGLW